MGISHSRRPSGWPNDVYGQSHSFNPDLVYDGDRQFYPECQQTFIVAKIIPPSAVLYDTENEIDDPEDLDNIPEAVIITENVNNNEYDLIYDCSN